MYIFITILLCYHILCMGAFTHMLIEANEIPALRAELDNMKKVVPYYKCMLLITVLVCSSYLITIAHLPSKSSK